MGCVRMTIDIPDLIYQRLNRRAAREGTSVSDLILLGGISLLGGNSRKSRKRLKLPIIRSKQPGTLALDNHKIFEIVPFP